MKKQKSYSLKMYLFSTFGCLFVLLLVTLTLWISASFSKTMREMSYDKYENVFQQSSQQLSMIFQDISLTASVLNNSPELISAVKLSLHASNQYTRSQNEATVRKLLTTASLNSSYIKNIYLYKDGKIITASNRTSPLSFIQYSDSDWFDSMAASITENKVLVYDENTIFFLSPFRQYIFEDSMGLLLFPLDTSLLRKCMKPINNEEETFLCVLDAEQNLLYTPNKEDTEFLEQHLPQMVKHSSGEKLHLGKSSYFLTKQTNDFSGWTLVSLVPGSIIFKGLTAHYLQILPFVLLFLALGIYLIFMVSRYITNPLKPLLESMKHSSHGNFAFQPYKTQIEEINTLIDGYDEMLQRISALIQEIQQIEKAKRNTELEILQAQISPHFIYNTLNSIRWLALMQNSPKIAEVISSFSALLQIASSHPGEFITVDEELQEVSCYLEIMEFRYNTNIQVVWDVDDTLRSCKTLKLIIQPLVENCYCHGFSYNSEGIIRIVCRREADNLVFQVKDNGAGFSSAPDALPISQSDGHHNIGLRNIHKRLQLWFGDDYGLTISSEPGIGTTVTLTQPLQQEKEETLS